MSHFFGIDELREKLIMLSALSLSGEEFCNRYKMGSTKYHEIYNLEEYTKTTKFIVSNYIIETSVKLRNLVDSLKSLEIEKDISYYNSGTCADGIPRNENFRFFCNKIIHAESFNLDFVGNKKYHKDMIWWSGEITVSGIHQKKHWELFFSIGDWCDAIVKFLNKNEGQINSVQNNSRDIQNHG